MFWSHEEFDGSCDAGLAPNQAGALECDNHLMNGGRADAEMALHVGLGGWPPEHMRVGVDEGQVLALPFGEALVARGA